MNPSEYSTRDLMVDILPRKENCTGLVLVTVSAYRNSSFPELGKPGREVIKLKDRSLLKFSEFNANKITY